MLAGQIPGFLTRFTSDSLMNRRDSHRVTGESGHDSPLGIKKALHREGFFRNLASQARTGRDLCADFTTRQARSARMMPR